MSKLSLTHYIHIYIYMYIYIYMLIHLIIIIRIITIITITNLLYCGDYSILYIHITADEDLMTIRGN